MKDLYQKMDDALEKVLRTHYPHIHLEPPLWEVPQRQEFGDFSTMIALKIASQSKENPYHVAKEIGKFLRENLSGAEKNVGKIDIIKPGFINLFFSKKALVDALNRVLKEKEKAFVPGKKRKVLIEFVSANPTGPLSIAHGRQAVVGDVIANILAFCGNNVVREYYINDEGRQIELFTQSVEERIKELHGEEFAVPEGGYLGEYVKEVARCACEAQPPSLQEFVLKTLLSWIKSDLNTLGITFDSWISQRELIGKGKVEDILHFLKEKGFLYEKDSALWFSATKFGDDKDRVLKKNDGTVTYFASDIAYHKNKLERGCDFLINLWGPDHHGYIPRVKAGVRALGFDDTLLRILIIQLVSIKTKEKMSKRKGTALFLSDLEKEVGKDAARFYYLTRRHSSPLEFDIDLAKTASFDNPLYYIQYAHARSCSIFKNAKVTEVESDYTSFLHDKEEFLLLRKILQFAYCIDKIYYSLEPVYLIEFLKDIATSFHKFYETKRVIGEGENTTMARLTLVEAVRIVIACSLNILGITPLREM